MKEITPNYPRPIRRKHKDNPYTIAVENNCEDKEHYFVSFLDNQNHFHKEEISREVFQLFDQFELEDLSTLNETDRHRAKQSVSEAAPSVRSLDTFRFIEESAIRNIERQKLHSIIKKLPSKQRKRVIKYYYHGLTYEEIARIDSCSYQAVQKSIKNALEKIKVEILGCIIDD